MKQSRTDKIFTVINFTLFTIMVILMIYPLIFVLSASVSDPMAVNGGKVVFFPKGLSFDSYQEVIKETKVWRAYANTIFYVAVDVGMSLLIMLPLCYALSRPDKFRFANQLSFMIAFTMLFGGGMVPLYIVLKKLHMINTVWSIVLHQTVQPWLIMVTLTFFRGLPKSLMEAAEIDGASFEYTFRKIVLPLSASIIVVIALFRFVGQWNNFFDPLIFFNDPKKFSLQLVLRNILLENQSMASGMDASMLTGEAAAEAYRRGLLAETMKYALIVVSTLPVLLIYPFMQKHLVKGVMIGAIKG